MELIAAIRTAGPLLCSTGRENAYRRAFKSGLGGSRKEATWDKWRHGCCNSAVYWRHKNLCKAAQNDDLPDFKELP